MADVCLEFGLVEPAVIPDLVEDAAGSSLAETALRAELQRVLHAGGDIEGLSRTYSLSAEQIQALLTPQSRISSLAPGGDENPEGNPSGPLPGKEQSPGSARLRPSRRLPRLGKDSPALSDSKRQRRGRRRLVRPDSNSDRAAVETEPPCRPPPRLKASRHSAVRVVALDEVDLSDLMPPAGPQLADTSPRRDATPTTERPTEPAKGVVAAGEKTIAVSTVKGSGELTKRPSMPPKTILAGPDNLLIP